LALDGGGAGQQGDFVLESHFGLPFTVDRPHVAPVRIPPPSYDRGPEATVVFTACG
jgi:hypothetical protein